MFTDYARQRRRTELQDGEPRFISLDNGLTYMTAEEAVKDEHFDVRQLAFMMYDEIRERVHSELAPCTDEEFLTRYLELAKHDLVVG